MSESLRRPAVVHQPINVMVVDDSAIVRGLVSKWLEATGDIKVVALAVDGVHALKKAAECDVDVCILDIEMPAMSGIEALPKLLALKPRLKVIMASTLSVRGAEITLRALNLGAADYIAKPEASRLGGAEIYRQDLVEKIRQLARRTPFSQVNPTIGQPSQRPFGQSRILRPEALVIASSTGGPPALLRLFTDLGDSWKAPILIAQHMPAAFTKTLAQMLDKVTPLRVKEASAGEPIVAGGVYVAPGDFHLTVRRSATGTVVVALNQDAPVNWCRPSADPLFNSAVEVWNGGVMGLVLTGMGHDGREGARAMKQRGCAMLAQDEATSVVWGMPGAVVEAGLATEVLPLGDIAPRLAQIHSGVAA